MNASPCRLIVALLVCSGLVSLLSPSFGQDASPNSATDSIATTRPMTKIFFGSCIKQDRPIPILRSILQQRPDLFVFLGDNIYADTTDMDKMQKEYGKLTADASFLKLIESTPVMATWDDHDYGANDAGADFPKRQQSQQVFLDFWDEPADSDRRKRGGVYDARIFGPAGKRVQVILLDTRYFRGPLQKGDRRVGGPYVPTHDPEITMLGEKQWSWLRKQLNQPAELRLIASSIQCVAEDAGQETWSNLPWQRQQLFDCIATAKANGVIMISGDRHWAELSVTNERTPYEIYDLTSSSLNQIHERGTPTDNRYRAIPSTYHRENYGAIQIDWERDDPTIQLQILDLGGQTKIEKRLRLSELQSP